MDHSLDLAFATYRGAKVNADRANDRLAEAEQVLLKELEARKQKTLTYSTDRVKFSVTYTQRDGAKINEQGLRRALTAKVFDKFTVKKLDRKALVKAMEEGEIDPRVVAQYVEDVPGKVYLTYRVKEIDE